MQWDNLKKAVAEVINANGVGAITGSNLQNVIKEVIDALGGVAGFKGLASIDTIPPTPDGLVFYFASEEGVYENFGGVAVPLGLSVIRNNFDSQGGIEWEVIPLITLTDEITPNGTQAVSARALYLSFWSLGLFNYPEFDINKPYSTGDIIRYNGMTVEILQEISGGRELEEGVDYKPISVSGNGGVQSDWDQADSTKPDFIKNKPNVPIIGESNLISQDKNGVVRLNPRILTESSASIDLNDPDLVGPYNQTLGRAEDAIERINKAIMDLGPWKDDVETKTQKLSNEVSEARGSSESLGVRMGALEEDVKNSITHSEVKNSTNVNWESEREVVSPKAISKRIESQVAELMTGRVTMKGKWSSIANEGNIVIEPGYQYVYDKGQSPFGIPLEPGDILIAVNRMESPSERENKDNWMVAQSNFDYANLEGRIETNEAEIKGARNGEENLAARLNKNDAKVNNISQEIQTARGGLDSLNDRFLEEESKRLALENKVKSNKSDADNVKAEVIKARGEEKTLNDRLDYIESQAIRIKISSDLSEIN